MWPPEALEPWLHEPACTARVREELDPSRPLVRWLTERVGPSTVARPRR